MLKQNLTFYIIFFIKYHFNNYIFIFYSTYYFSRKRNGWFKKEIIYEKYCYSNIVFIISSAYYFLFFLLYLIIQQTQLKAFDAVFSAIMLLFCPYLINKLFDTMLPKEKLETGIKKTI